MTVERTESEVIIRLPASMDIRELQGFLNYLQYRELTAHSKATEEQLNELVQDVKKGRWENYKQRLKR